MSEKLVVDGVIFSSLKSACSYYNVPYHRVRKRLKLGWSLEESLKERVFTSKNKGKKVLARGVEYNSLKDVADEYNVVYQSLLYRVNTLNYSIDEALDYFLENDNRVWVFENIFDNAMQACNFYNANYSSVMGYIKKGMTVEDAIAKFFENKSTKGEIENLGFKSIKGACNSLNICYNTVLYRLSQGWLLVEALGISPKCDGEVISAKHWNKSIGDVKIKEMKGRLYFCTHNGFPRYYTKEEMFKIWKEQKRVLKNVVVEIK